MSGPVIPILDLRTSPYSVDPKIVSFDRRPADRLVDVHGRLLRDLRISVTDRCNFRCQYCMPKEVFDRNYKFLSQSEVLTFEEIVRLAKIFVMHGVRKIRLTGGEPLLRKDVEVLVAELSKLRAPGGEAIDLALTTNGSLLARKAAALREAGLKRITVSLDALDNATFSAMNDVGFPVERVLEGIDVARSVGFSPIKVNMVVKKGTNDDQIVPMAQHFRSTGVLLRFIEYMDVGASNGWKMGQVLSSRDVLAVLRRHWNLVPIGAGREGAETAERWYYQDGAGEIGFISSVTAAFCGDCTRARLSTDGQLYLCLFAGRGYDIRSLLRGQHKQSDQLLAQVIAGIWSGRGDRYSELRGHRPPLPNEMNKRVEMHYIGG